MMDPCHCTFVQTHRKYTGENLDVNYGLWTMTTYQRSFNNHNKRTTPVGMLVTQAAGHVWA